MRGTRGIRSAVLWTALAGVVAAGCQAASSSGIATQDIYADISATADGSGNTRVYTDLKVGGALSNTFIALSPADTLVAYAGSSYQMSAQMAESNVLGYVSYASNFAADADSTPFKVSFFRVHSAGQQCDAVSAPNSLMTLPARFSLSGPAGGSSFSRQSGNITLTWSPSGSADQMHWGIAGSCVLGGGTINGDPGTYTIAAGTLVNSTNSGTCSATLTLYRDRAGTLDPAYGAGGQIFARQQRSVSITSTQ